MLLSDLSDYLSTGNVGSTDIFCGWVPMSPDTLIAIHETGGLPSVHAMASGPGQAMVEQPRVQIQVRDADYESARLIMHRVHARLDGTRNQTINGVTYHWIEAVQQPFFLHRDENSRFVLACNYQITKGLSTTST